MTDIPKLNIPALPEFLASLNSEGTRLEYASDLRAFEGYLNGIPIEGVTLSTLLGYRTELQAKGLKVGTINKRIAVVKSYFAFLIQVGILERNPAEGMKLKGQSTFVETEGLSNEEVCRILEAIPESNLMHRAVLSTLFYLGLRRSELCKLTVADLSADGIHGTLTVLGKGNKKRTLPIPTELFGILQLYLSTSRTRMCATTEPVFVSNRNGIEPLHPNTIRGILAKYCKLAGITKRISPHSARVTAVSNALENGANPIYVQAMGGWSSMNMVLRYDRRRLELKNSAVYAVDYRSKK